jgi:hypothetical protein
VSTVNDNRLHAYPGVAEAGNGARPVHLNETPQQRDRALTIFEKSREGRRAFVAPALDVPERPGRRAAAGAHAPRERRPRFRRSPSRRSCATTRA